MEIFIPLQPQYVVFSTTQYVVHPFTILYVSLKSMYVSISSWCYGIVRTRLDFIDVVNLVLKLEVFILGILFYTLFYRSIIEFKRMSNNFTFNDSLFLDSEAHFYFASNFNFTFKFLKLKQFTVCLCQNSYFIWWMVAKYSNVRSLKLF